MIHLSACTVPLIERMAAAAATFHTQLGHVANTAEQKGAAPGTQAVAAPAAASLLPIARSRRETDATKNAADCEPSLPRRHQRRQLLRGHLLADCTLQRGRLRGRLLARELLPHLDARPDILAAAQPVRRRCCAVSPAVCDRSGFLSWSTPTPHSDMCDYSSDGLCSAGQLRGGCRTWGGRRMRSCG